jgi:hypothetical protein
MSDGFTLTDNAYGTKAGESVDEHEFFVPDIAVGRLVETPEDIVKTIKTFRDNSGTLDSSTASSSLVTGYDFAGDGATSVAGVCSRRQEPRPAPASRASWLDRLAADPAVARTRTGDREPQQPL